jgi:acetyl-CoA carboxylase carboxyl transferase subunit alpha
MQNFLDFEKPLLEIQTKIEELRHLKADSKNIANELTSLQEKYDEKLKEIYSNLTPWQKVKVCRHQDRPKINDFIENIFEDFINLSGDRSYSEDSALRGGIGEIDGHSVIVLGNDKGNNIDSRVKNNFGMAKPEGYRKAIRLMSIANKFEFPIITFIDTPGAFPGVDAEDRGQSEAIASSIKACLKSSSPIFSFVVGEGGSGGAIALGVGNEVVMLENSIYSVISPEGCASILWRDSEMANKAALSLKLTAQDLLELNVIDDIIQEPIGGAHRNIFETCSSIKKRILIYLEKYKNLSDKEILEHREKKFLEIGEKFIED